MWKAIITLTDEFGIEYVFTSIPITSKGMAIHYAMLEMKDSDQYRELIAQYGPIDFDINVSASKIS